MDKQSIYAKLYTDGCLILSSYDYTDTKKQLKRNYGKITQSTWENINNNYVKSIIVWDNIILPYYINFMHMDNVEEMDLRKLDTSHVSSMKFLFYYCSNLVSLDLGNFDTSKVKDMSFMFYNCSKLKNLNIESFDTSKVEDMNKMFDGCSNLEKLNLRNFNTSRVKDMSRMFFKCSNLKELDLTSFNTSNVQSMNMMFYGCLSIEKINLTSFNTSNVESMGFMFNNCSNLKELNLSNFDTSNVKDMERMFYGCSSIKELDLTGFDTTNVEDMNKMFGRCVNLESIYTEKFDTSNVTDMDNIFKFCDSLKNVEIKIKSDEEISKLIRKKEEEKRKQEEEIIRQERMRKEEEKAKREERKREEKVRIEKNKQERILKESNIIEAYKNGTSIQVISKEYDVVPNTVKNILVRNSVKIRYDTLENQGNIDDYCKKLYEWLEKNNISFKPKDRTKLKVSVDALLLGEYSNIAIQVLEKPKFMSKKRYEDDINQKIKKAKDIGLDILFLKKDDFNEIDNIKETIDNLKDEREKNFIEFNGIVISKDKINKFQKLYYALAIKDVFSKNLNEIEYDSGKYLDIDEFENLIKSLPESYEKIYRYCKSLDGNEYTNIEICQKVGVSQQQVSIIKVKLEKSLSRPYIKRKYEEKIIRDYKRDSEKIKEYNNEINTLKIELEDLEIINMYFKNITYRNENIDLSKLNINQDKNNKLREDNINNIQDLIKKYDNKLSPKQQEMYIYDIRFPPKVYFNLERKGIKGLKDVVNTNENILYDIRTFGKTTLDEITDKFSELGLHMQYSIDELDFLSTRAELTLMRAGIRKMNDLLNLTEEELAEIDGLGKGSYNEIIDKIKARGLKLKSENGEKSNDFRIEYWDIVTIKWEKMMKCFKNAQLFRLSELEQNVSERDELINKIEEYNKAMKQHLDKVE